MDQLGLEVIIPIIIALVGSIPGVLSFIRMLRKDKVEGVAIISSAEKDEADATNIYVTAATSLIDPLVAKIEKMEVRERERERVLSDVTRRLALVERNNLVLCDGVKRLILQIRSMGATPVFSVDEDLCDEISKNSEVNAGHLT